MIYITEQYYGLNRTLLLIIGLWPYQQSNLVRLQFIFFSGILITAALFQFSIFITSRCTPDLLIKVLSLAFFLIVFMINYISFSVNIENMKDLLTQLQYICNELEDENEHAIIRKYSYIAKCYTVGFTMICVSCIIFHLIVQNWRNIVCIVLPFNESRYHYIMTEYFSNQKRYYFLMLHTYAALSIGAMAMLATGAMLNTFLQHICGMFTISCYRIERAVKFNVLKNNLNKESVMSKGLIYAIDIHRQAMKLSTNLMSGFDPWFFGLILFGVASLSLNLLRIFLIVSSENDFTTISLPFIFVTISTLYMFLSNSIGQDIMDHNYHVFLTVYNVPWYLAPLPVQKMILFLLQKTAKDFALTVGGLFFASFECFASGASTLVDFVVVMYVSCLVEMVCVVKQYFNFNRILLLALGLWPYQHSKYARYRFIFFLSIITTAILFQYTTLLTSKCTLDLIIEILSISLYFITIAMIYITFNGNVEDIKDLLIQLQHVYNQLKDKNEYTIVEKYNHYAKCYTVILISIGIGAASIFIAAQYSSSILDVLSPINESRSRSIQFNTEYFVNQEKYYFFILFHINAAFGLGIMVLLAIGTMPIAYLLHICAMFRIASYRIERAVGVNVELLKNNNRKDESFTCKGIICAVDIHRQAIKLSKHLVSKIDILLCCLIMITVISLSLNLFRAFQVVTSESDVTEFLLPFLFVASNISYMFLANIMGQYITDHNHHVFVTAYNVQWYTAPLHVQKMILFLLQKGTKDFTLSVGGLFVASIECFATLVKASVSYFTVIYSTR
ncbi:uncharacterized protein [Linepithema humile]|uniref:uncharacterized protein n=1 Tax=Linepithema humile TaxID=83485 RepID=UPI00351DE25F